MQLTFHESHNLSLFEPNQREIAYPLPKTILQLKDFEFADGRRPRLYQAEDAYFAENKAKFRCIIADDTGLGKTLAVLLTVAQNPEKLLPALIVCKTTIKVQWFIEIFKSLGLVPDIIKSTNELDLVNEDAPIHIISYDLLKRIDEFPIDKPKLVVMDECQQIKNWDSARTQAIVKFCADIPYIIGTSATPILNDALEYYPFLHICHPERFSSRSSFEIMCEQKQMSSGSWKRGGISKYYEPIFRKMTEDIIIRHKREDVAPELPKVVRNYRFVKIENADDQNALYEETAKFVDAYDNFKNYDKASGDTYSEARNKASASLMRLRHIIGDSKIPYALDFIEEFLNENEERKLVVFVHHKTVAEGIINGVRALREAGDINIEEPHILRGGMNEEVRNNLVMKCTLNGGWPDSNKRSRLMIASTLAAGEGINLQRCFDFLMVERQFNPPKEEQAEGRFSRVGIDAAIVNIFGTYLSVLGTLDDWFAKLVDFKRESLRKTHGDKEEYGAQWDDEDTIITDLMDMAADESRKLLRTIKKVKRKKNDNN